MDIDSKITLSIKNVPAQPYSTLFLEPPIAPGYNGESTWLLRLHPGTGGGKNRNLPRGECLALGLDVN
ncbi:MAG TPA: hypothetical protein VEL70_06935 [Candidatus Acidoferrum sp.]|nr:hypothetical protein [Candidatus Acidoferrum sp.]